MIRRIVGKRYIQVLIGVSAPLGDVFIKLIRMVFAPIIFAMVVLGVARLAQADDAHAGLMH